MSFTVLPETDEQMQIPDKTIDDILYDRPWRKTAFRIS